MMKNLNEIKKSLLSYIAQKQVAFQFGDGLICFTKPEDNYDSFDMEFELPNMVDKMKTYIHDAESIYSIKRESLFDDQLGFAEFASWSHEQDSLYLVDDCLLICVPESSSLCQ